MGTPYRVRADFEGCLRRLLRGLPILEPCLHHLRNISRSLRATRPMNNGLGPPNASGYITKTMQTSFVTTYCRERVPFSTLRVILKDFCGGYYCTRTGNYLLLLVSFSQVLRCPTSRHSSGTQNMVPMLLICLQRSIQSGVTILLGSPKVILTLLTCL